MALPSSGALSLDDIQTEFGGTNPIAISEYYGAATGVPASGTISISDFYGTSAVITADFGYIVGGFKTISSPSRTNTGAKFTFSNQTFSSIPTYPTTTIYDNNGLQSIPNGYGYKISSSGQSHLGYFENGLENGLGKSINQDGIITYEGFWKDGIPIK